MLVETTLEGLGTGFQGTKIEWTTTPGDFNQTFDIVPINPLDHIKSTYTINYELDDGLGGVIVVPKGPYIGYFGCWVPALSGAGYLAMNTAVV